MSNLNDKLKKIKDKIKQCESIDNLPKLEGEFSNLKDKVNSIKKPKQKAPLAKRITEIESLLLEKQEAFNPPLPKQINEERQPHMIAFLRELEILTRELNGLKRVSIDIKELSQEEQNRLNEVQEQLQEELEQNVDSALTSLTNVSFQYLTNEIDLKEFKVQASSTIENLKVQINGTVVNPNAKLKALEITVINAPKDPARQKQLTSFRSQILAMRGKAFALNKKGHSNASAAATLLCDELTKIASEYEENKISLSTLKSSSENHLQTAHKELDNHRGWKRVLKNVALFVGTLGIGYAIGALCKRSFFAINPKTDSAIQINDIENEINKMKGG